jgi:hypothetical protein
MSRRQGEKILHVQMISHANQWSNRNRHFVIAVTDLARITG